MARRSLSKRKRPDPSEPEVKRFRLTRTHQIWVNNMPEPSASLYRAESDDQGNLIAFILKRKPNLPPTKEVALYQGDDFYHCKIIARFSDNYKGQKVKIRPGLPNHGPRPELIEEAEIDLTEELTQ